MPSKQFQGSGFMKKLVLSSVAVAAMFALAGSANAQIKIGVAGPITGPNAAFGAQLKNGAEQAAADINAKGGVNGQKIELVFGDDVSDPKQGVSVANKMVGDGVKFVMGHFNSGVTIPASEVYAENGVLMITPSATNPKITERGLWNTFRTCGRDDQQGEVAGKYIATTLKGKKLAIVHDKTTYGKGLADETQKFANKEGVKEVLYEGVNTGEKDFSALVSKIKASGAEIVYWGGLHTEGGLIARQMRDQGVTATMMSGDGITSDEFASIGGPAVEGTLMTFPPDPRKRPEAAAVVKAFEAKKFNPEAYTLYSYAALEVIAGAAAEAKSLDPKKIAETIKNGKPWPTVIGGLAFDKKGDITRPDYVMYTWKKGADGKTTYVQN
jgi:branched-chain amino acid transport system substrate-binding protein